jgi:hypothetical protein
MLELDIYLPDIKVAFEYNGTYWHSKEKTKITDRIKNKICKEKNIKLITILENDWMRNKNTCLEKIRSLFH